MSEHHRPAVFLMASMIVINASLEIALFLLGYMCE